MRPLLAGLAVAAVLALGACYQSRALLLDPRQAARPLATGSQTLADEGEKPQALEIRLEPDGWYRIASRDGRDEDERVLITPLAGAGEGRFAFAFGSRGAFTYGVAEQRDGRVYLDLPFCDLGPARDIALAHGVGMAAKGAMAPVCTFQKAADLNAALADYAVRPGARPTLPSLPAAPQ